MTEQTQPDKITRTAHRICPICEATCGLVMEVDDANRTVDFIRGNKGDVLSGGYICPKGVAVKELHDDPDRLRTPLIRRGGNLEPATWDEAFAEIKKRLTPLLRKHGPQSMGIYFGNPSAHKQSLGMAIGPFLKSVGTSNIFSASTLDQMPKQVSCAYMFGDPLAFPVPDIDRCSYLVIMGANPMVSNGSLWTVPDFRGRARAMRARGGKIVVIDPKNTETAKVADAHLPILPGSDAYFLLALIQTMFDENLVDLSHLEGKVAGFDEIQTLAQDYTPEAVSSVTSIPADSIRRVARNLSKTKNAALYARIGTSVSVLGTTVSWLVDVVNILAGNLDREGGVMWGMNVSAPEPASEGKSDFRVGRYTSRVSGYPEVMGEFPAIALAEEIEEPGEGQIRALVTIAGNPALSAPNGTRLSRALDQLDFMVSLDIYLNETTRHADVVLPGVSSLEEFHYPAIFQKLAVRKVMRYSPPIFDIRGDRPSEWEILNRLSLIVSGQDDDVDVEAFDHQAVSGRIKAMSNEGGPLEGRDPAEIIEMMGDKRGPERMIELTLRTGPYGDLFGARPDGLTLQKLIDTPDGIDLGPLDEAFEAVVSTPSGKIELAPGPIMEDLPRVRTIFEKKKVASQNDGLLMVGRRHVRTNNSWLHNLPLLAKGKFKGALQIHPADAASRALRDGDKADISNANGKVCVEIEISEDMMPGVVSLPHGFGHVFDDTNLSVATNTPGVNSNLLASDKDIDPLSGTSALNGIPVQVQSVG